MKKIAGFILIWAMLFMGGEIFAEVTTGEMAPVVNKVKTEISTSFTVIDNDLALAAKKLAGIDHKSKEARDILSGLCKDRPYVFDCAIINKDGKLSVIEPIDVQNNYLGRDVSFESQVEEVLKTKKPVLSKIFRCLDGVYRVDFEYPIINNKGELFGSLSLLVNNDVFLRDIIAPIVRGKPCNVWVMETNGMILYDPDPNQINKDIFTDPMFASFQDLVLLSKHIADNSMGSGEYTFYKKGIGDKTIVKKTTLWHTVSLYGTSWRIVAMEII